MTTQFHYYPKTLAQAISGTLEAMENCRKTSNSMWLEKHRDTLKRLQKLLPSGSGFDAGSHIDEVENDATRGFRLRTSFHHMNDVGYYDGWTEHMVRVRATFHGLDITVTGSNRNDIKDHIAEVFRDALSYVLTLDEWLKAHDAMAQHASWSTAEAT